MIDFENPYLPPAGDASVAVESVNVRSRSLPPVSVRLWSLLFSFFTLCPLLLIGATRPSVMFLAFRFTAPPSPLLTVYVLSALLTLAGLVGLAILLRWRLAYDFAMLYCVAAILIAAILHFVVDLRSIHWINAFTQYPMLLWFAWHVAVNRKRWRVEQTKNR